MYLYGVSEIVASNFRPKLPARTIYNLAAILMVLEPRQQVFYYTTKYKENSFINN